MIYPGIALRDRLDEEVAAGATSYAVGVEAASPDWRAIHEQLSGRERSTLTAAELDLLGESLFWLDRPHESMMVLGQAFTAHAAAGDHAGAVMAAWQLYYDHALVGEMALANGWLERARRHASYVQGSAAAGFLAVAESDHAAAAGAFEDAARHAELAVDLGHVTGDADLNAMGLQARGRSLLACGRISEGMAALDEAMVAVVNGELRALFTGWVYCNALSACHDIADLRRAVQWSEAAVRWCDDLREGRLYPGICRLHVVEVACLQGAWKTASALAAQACEDLTSHDPRYAGEAHYLIGELRRLTGDVDLAEEAFTEANQLGRVPQPGLALVRLTQGRVGAAIKGLELALESGPPTPMRRSTLLAALAEAHLVAGDLDAAKAASAELVEVARGTGSDYLRAVACLTDAQVLLATDGTAAFHRAGDAVEHFRALGLRYDEARAREVRGLAARGIEAPDAAQLELAAAEEAFRRIGADHDARRVRAHTGATHASPLSSRETEVLRLVARGATNKEVAATLVVSEHTVARHLSNIYTKLGVGSRAAATAFAYEHSLI